jgi:hypothetical protein
MVIREFIEHRFQFFVETVLQIIHFIVCWGMGVQNNDNDTSNLHHPIAKKVIHHNC